MKTRARIASADRHDPGRPALPWLLGCLALASAVPGACRGAWTAPPGASGMPVEISAMADEERLARGAELFGTHCVVCHGEAGAAKGPASPYLFPPARDFGQGRFRLVSTTNGVPLDRDLVDTLGRGMPGSAMPAWSWLPEEDLWCLAAHVRRLAEQGIADRLQSAAAEADEELDREQALSRAREAMTPARRFEPLPVARGASARARGRKLYEENCSMCHARDGSGEPEPRWNEDGSLNWARDFTAGFLKGGASPREIGWRIQAGLPGSAMPPTVFASREDVAAVVAYVRELIPPDAESALVQKRETLHVRRVPDVPEDPGAPDWSRSQEIEVELAPLWWRTDSVQRVTVQALHDGEDIGLLLSWDDNTCALNLFSDVNLSDAVAVQFSNAAAPPLFGMGTEEHETTIWHWKSLRLSEVAGATDLLEPVPHVTERGVVGVVRVDAPVYRQLEGVPAVSERVDSLSVSGVESARSAERVPSRVHVEPRWKEGRWQVLFLRRMAPVECSEITFHPGTSLQFACAVWNGEAGDQGPQKSISIWQELAVD